MAIEPSEMFKVLGVETRVKIINLLKSRGSIGTKTISSLLGITPAAVSQHLKVLRQAGLVKNERKGYWIPYSIDEEVLEKCRQVLNEVCTCGCGGKDIVRRKELESESLEALKKYREELERELKSVEERIGKIKHE